MHSKFFYRIIKGVNTTFLSLAKKNTNTTTTKTNNQVELGSSLSEGEGGPGGPFQNKSTKGAFPSVCYSVSHISQTVLSIVRKKHLTTYSVP